MRRHADTVVALALSLMGAVGCAPTELDLNVLVDPDGVVVHVREVDRHCECTTGNFAAPAP